MRCVKCGKELKKPVCAACGFDHKSGPVLFLAEYQDTPLRATGFVTVQGVPESQLDAPRQYEQGKQCFVRGDYAGAVQWLQTPAQKGNHNAQFLLGRVYAVSDSHLNITMELYWYEQAAERGNMNALNALIRYYEKTKPEDKQEQEQFLQRLQLWKAKLREVLSGNQWARLEPFRAVEPQPTPQSKKEPKPKKEPQPKKEPKPKKEPQPKKEPKPKKEPQPKKESQPKRKPKTEPVAHKDFELQGSVLVKYTGTEHFPVIPAGVTQIGDEAFRGNSNLLGIRIPEGVTRIGNSAFFACFYLQEVQLPSTLKTIGDYAFAETPLLAIELPEGLTSLGEKEAFSGTELFSVTIPGSVRVIPAQTFSNCAMLTMAVLKPGVQSIEAGAFEDCGELRVLHLPDTIQTIGKGDGASTGAFAGCENLSVVHASDSWKKAHPDLLRRIIPETEDSRNFEIAGNKLVRYWGKAAHPAIPGGIAEIGERAFYKNASIKSIEIPAGVRKIGDDAFSGCSSLQRIQLPEGLTALGANAFFGCGSLQWMQLPKTLTALPTNVFGACTGLREIEVPGNIKTIGFGAFNFCDELTVVKLAPGVQELRDSAFSYCKKLHTVQVPDSLTVIGIKPDSLVFQNCDQLTRVVASQTWERQHWTLRRKIVPDSDERRNFHVQGGKLIRYWGKAQEVILPAGVTEIGENAFKHNKAITRLNVPSSVLSIGAKAFWGSNLESITLHDGLQSIGAEAFTYCSNLKTIAIPKGVQVLPERVFYGCSQLTEMEIPGNVKTIGKSAFGSCGDLQRVAILAGVERIEPEAFSGCSSLKTVIMPDTVTSVAPDAFAGIIQLETLQASSKWKRAHGAFMKTISQAAP